MNGNSGSGLTGSILAPCSAVTVDGTGDAGINGQIIGYTVNISGTSLMKIFYNAGVNYFGPISPKIELTQ